MTLFRKHFISLAQEIDRMPDPVPKNDVIQMVADLCSEKGKNFDRSKFINACNGDW